MQLLLITERPSGYTAGRLQLAARRAGATLTALSPAVLEVHLGGGAPRIVHGGRGLRRVDGVWVRPGAAHAAHAVLLGQLLESRGARPLVPADRLWALGAGVPVLARLAAAGLPVARAASLSRRVDTAAALRHLGRRPLVFSPPAATGWPMGAAAVRPGPAELDAVLSRGGRAWARASADGGGLRCVVVGGKVVAAVTWADGGQARVQPAARPARLLAVAAARALGLAVCGVDLVHGRSGWCVQHATASMALEAAESLCGVDVAAAVLGLWMRRVRAGQSRAG